MGGEIIIFGQVMRGEGVEVAIKVQHKAKEVHCRGGSICGGIANQSMGKAAGVGMDGVIQRRGW